ncbi:MAG: prephenate dehydrogenase [Acidobacteriota bacterium]
MPDSSPPHETAPFRRIGLVGVGLIGGSVGLAVKAGLGPAVRITGVDPGVSAAEAVAAGAVDRMSGDVADACSDADLVILAPPAGEILSVLPRLAGITRPGVLVTDVAGAKTAICDAGERALDGHGTFIGGHPMAGAERGGIGAARADLFHEAAWVLCAGPDQAAPGLTALESLIRTVGARPVRLSPERHDRAVARVSHVPQLLALALLMQVADDGHREDLLALAGGGFSDLTRIGSSPFAPWQDVLQQNASRIQAALDDLGVSIAVLRELVGTRPERLEDLFRKAQGCRRQLGSRRPLGSVDAADPGPS